MGQLRIRFAVFLLWVIVFFNIDRFSEPDVFTLSAYFFAAATSIAAVVAPGVSRIPVPWAVVGLVPSYAVFKGLAGYPLLDNTWPMTLMEIFGTVVTVLLAMRVRQSLDAFREAVRDVMTSQLSGTTLPFDSGHSELYREICRARHYKRPASMLAISIGNGEQNHAMHRFVEEAQRSTLHEYVAGRLAQLLTEELKSCDIVARRGGHFLTLLPEMGPQEVARLVGEIEAVAMEKLGLELKIGVASFPDQEVTFDGLIERAEADMLTPRPRVTVADSSESDESIPVVSIRIDGTDARHVTTSAPMVANAIVTTPSPLVGESAVASHPPACVENAHS